MIGMDTETTGLDFNHGARPYLITIAMEDGRNAWWEFEVDPYTREVHVPEWAVTEISGDLNGSEVVFHNAKFDLKALSTIGIHPQKWDHIHDSLLADHVLFSNQPHDLNSVALRWLSFNLKRCEDAVKEATKEARAIARRDYPDWLIAKPGLSCMPSAKGECWKYDMWLPRAVANDREYPSDHPWWTVCADYANPDSTTCLTAFLSMERELEDAGLYEVYRERLKLLPVIVGMESTGVTFDLGRYQELKETYEEDVLTHSARCTAVAQRYEYDLVLPKGGLNKSLQEFVFSVLELPVMKRTRKGSPSLDREALEMYQASTTPNTMVHSFVRNLIARRKKSTSLSYLESYLRFGKRKRKNGKVFYRLYPSLNSTGTDTLRMSSSNPNQQNISKLKDEHGLNIRHAFGPTPGREWWALDYDNIELRIPAYEAEETEMIELFEHPDVSPFFGSNHLLVFSILWPREWQKAINEHGPEKVAEGVKYKYKDTLYQWTKNGNFAVQYGAIEASGTADRAYHQHGAQRKIKSRFRKIARLNTKMIDKASTFGYVETLPDLTLDPPKGYRLWCTRSSYGEVKPTVPLNYHVQGTAMWCMCKAMVRCSKYLEDTPGNIIMQVHDELVFDFPKGQGGNHVEKLRSLMEQSGEDIGVPLKASIGYHPNNWGMEERYEVGTGGEAIA